MKRTMTMLLGTFALAISVLAVAAVAGAAPSGLVDSSNRVIFNSGSLKAVFEGNVPHITIYATNEVGRITYQLTFSTLMQSTNSSTKVTYDSPMMMQRLESDSTYWTTSSYD